MIEDLDLEEQETQTIGRSKLLKYIRQTAPVTHINSEEPESGL
jgi:hypothetical protein